jgi:hypothetical protein
VSAINGVVHGKSCRSRDVPRELLKTGKTSCAAAGDGIYYRLKVCNLWKDQSLTVQLKAEKTRIK